MDTDAHNSDSEPGGFTLSVDLSSYVGSRAHCRVWVRTRARKVRWLANRVRRAAQLRGPLLLKAGECLLPPGEPLKVIQPDDTISVVRVEHKWQRPFSFHDDDEEVPIESATTIKSNSPAKLPSTLELESTTPLEKPLQPAKQKHIMQELVTEEQPSVKPALKRQHQSLTIEQYSEEPILVDHKALNHVKQRALALLQQVTGDDIQQDVVDAPKKKRRRVRRRRPCKDVNLDFSVEAAESRSFENGPEIPIPKGNQDESMEEADASNSTQNGSLHTQTPPSPAVPLSVTSASAVQSPPVQLSTTSASVLAGPAASLSMASVSAVPSPTILTYPPPSALVRNPTPARAPRVVRALSTEPVLKVDAALLSTN